MLFFSKLVNDDYISIHGLKKKIPEKQDDWTVLIASSFKILNAKLVCSGSNKNIRCIMENKNPTQILHLRNRFCLLG